MADLFENWTNSSVLVYGPGSDLTVDLFKFCGLPDLLFFRMAALVMGVFFGCVIFEVLLILWFPAWRDRLSESAWQVFIGVSFVASFVGLGVYWMVDRDAYWGVFKWLLAGFFCFGVALFAGSLNGIRERFKGVP